MPVLTGVVPQKADAVTDLTLAQARAALLLINGDQEARRLIASTSATPDVDGALGQWLYRVWWSGVDKGPPSAAVSITELTTVSAAAALEAARRTVAPTSSGWLVLAATDDMIVAGHLHSGKRTTVRSDAVLSSSRPGMPARPGDLVTVITGASGLEPSQGWWRASTGDLSAHTGQAFDRWYVHAADLDATLVAVPLLLDLLIKLDCEASLKCPPGDALFGRRDAIVIYLPREFSAKAEAALPGVAASMVGLLRSDVPPLTRQLLPGLATAQDPGGTVSYGQLRCAQLAAIAAQTNPACSDDQLATLLADVGIDPRHPEVVAP
jgi:hypothetical protein